MMKRIVWIIGLFLLSSVVIAQDDECPQLIYEAISQVSDACLQTGRNEICYGNAQITAIPRADAELSFEQAGDISQLQNIESIQTSGLNLADAEFGIALMRVQATVPDSLPGQVINFLLMGDASIQDHSENPQQPMQAFYFSPGIGESRCQGYDYDTLVIDSPDGLHVTFNINGVAVDLGSTAVIVSQEQDTFDMLIVEGEATVTSNESSVTVSAGNWTQISTDGELAEPVSFPPERIEHIPFALLHTGENVALGKPVTADVWQETDPPEHVVNGIRSGEDNWNAGSAPPHWIEIDLEEEFATSRMRLMTSQYPAAQYDRTVHQILVAGEDHVFRAVHKFDQETRDDEWLEFIPDTPLFGVRYVRVESISSIHHGSWGEIEVYSAGFVGCVVSASNLVNLRVGAGTEFDIVGQLSSGETAIVSGRKVTEGAYVWWRLRPNIWVRSDVVQSIGACDRVPFVDG
jgi:hypothetical protein